MKMRVIKKVFSLIIIIVITILIYDIVSNIVERKYSKIKYHDFFCEKEDFDVLFLGSSHVIDGFSPMDMWRENGIVSYNLGGYSNTIPSSYWVMMNALEYTTPKVVVIDGYLIESQYKISGDNYSSIHNSLDAFPLNKTKINAVFDLLDDSVVEDDIERGLLIMDEERTPIGLLWDYSVYHSRWNDLSKEDFRTEFGHNKGAEEKVLITPLQIQPNNAVAPIEGIGVEYLAKIIYECKKRNIDVLITYLPSSDGNQPLANGLEEYAKKMEVSYLNFMDDKLMYLINPSTDFADSRGHLNPSGAKKISSYISNYLVEQYEVIDRRANSDFYCWNEDYTKYVSYKIDLLKQQTDVDLYMLLLNDSSFACKITCNSDFYEKNAKIIDNISTLGDCQLSIEEGTEIDALVGNIVDAKVDVYFNGDQVDNISILGDAIIRTE